MQRYLILAFLFLSAGLARPALAQTDGLPPRPTPFQFVNDQAQLMAPADAKKLNNGLRRYADNTGTQVVVVTVPSLGGRDVADYGRALGTAWGVGQRNKNNGVVVLLSAQEHKVTIQPGSGLQSVITPEVTSRVINEMTPSFKQNNYFAGLRQGLNTLMATANPGSAKDATAGSTAATAATGAAGTAATDPAAANLNEGPQTQMPTGDPIVSPPTPEPSSGPGMGTLLIGALVIGGILWFVVKMLRGRSAANAAQNNGGSGGTPNFLPNRPNGPQGGGYPQQGGNYGPGYGQAPASGGGMGMGGMLATGAAAAAGAYLGNRMASGHDTSGNGLMGNGNVAGAGNSNYNTGAGVAGAAGTGAASDYFSGRDGGGADTASGPDYFSDANTADDNSSDFFSSDDNSTYDDTSSDDTGGGGFDSTNDNSGSW